jgi:hypothetical protein
MKRLMSVVDFVAVLVECPRQSTDEMVRLIATEADRETHSKALQHCHMVDCHRKKRCGRNLHTSSNRQLINSLYCSNLIINLNAAQMSIELLLSLTFRTSDIEANVNHIVVTRHVGSPIDSELIDDRCLARFSVTENDSNEIGGNFLGVILIGLHFN